MKRKPITLLVGMAVIAGLTGAYVALKSHNEKIEEAALEEASGEEILSVDSDSISKISFYINGEEETFCLEEGQWKLERDKTFPVDNSKILASVTQLAPLQAVRILENVEDVSEYGLDEPQNVITLVDASGQETKVTIGDTNSGTGNDYLMLGEDETVVYTVEDTLRTTFSDDLYDYAHSDEMPALLVSDMTGVSVESGESGYELYLEDAQWMVGDLVQKDSAAEEPETVDAAKADKKEMSVINGTTADNEAVNTAMSSLGSLTYSDYVDHNCTDDSVYGFDETDTVLTIYYQVEVPEAVEEESEQSATEAVEKESEQSGMEVSEEESEQSATETGLVEASSEQNETETETETQKETRRVSFKIGTTDSLGNYYVQMTDSTEVHTLSSTILDNFLGKTAVDFEAVEVVTVMETEMETETAEMDETEIEAETVEMAEIETE